ncbi:alpha/beta hydrolase fold [Streptomyces sp. KS_16]|nr:alpha/beta hydrolase family protein [Streptomyces sp. 2321.6]SDR56518.1 alpha/beta hydrolase fold [Streptomyces sp. KS_16]SEB99566.1 alpha/beta hydrolase fold [Streptomyces sp. 2133.1]SNC63510.1 alpha/beta hydrolase fold [Streptomyces sp. 2114.4]
MGVGGARCVRRRRASVRLSAVAALAALLAGFAGTPAAAAADDPDLTSFYQQKLSWAPCGKDLQHGARSDGTGQPPGFRKRLECARLRVPQDYRNPGQHTMQVQLIRLKATGPGKRIGSLVLNPGGPGASGVNYLTDSGSAFARLGQRYDLVSFDPRGTRHTDPVSCGSKLAPPGKGADDSLAAKEKRINDACGRYSGGLLRWVGTPDVARDMDVLRAAVHDDKLNYLGFSYGTRLGAVYAHEFPHKVGRMVLDSVEDPTKNQWQTALSQARGFQRALDDFAADCVHRPDCALGTDEHKAQDQLRAWYRELGEQPMKAKGETVDETTYVYALREALYSRSDWPALRQALSQLRTGDASGILRLSDAGGSSAARAPGVPARRVGQDDLPSQDQLALRAISCRDTTERYGERDYPRAERELTKASPLFGPDIAPTLLDCYSWPVAGDDASRDVAAPDAPPILLVATTNDPATPYQGAFNMARELGNSSTVLTFRGEGHAAYTTGDPCVQRHVDDFLLDGTLPKGKISCG